MHTLFIDTHLLDIIIILYKDGKLVDKKEVINKKNNSEYIFPTIKKVINDIKLDEIIVVNGPGSFTGVRLGVTIAKTLAYTLNIPIKTITSLEVMCISSNKQKVAFNDGNGYYIGEFNNKNELIDNYKYINNEEYNNNYQDYYTDYIINPEKVYEFLINRKPINAHLVNPIYVKKIGVEIDKDSTTKRYKIYK